ncbi:ArsR/SmtB family transcription factor [Microbacterium sulfonylureivorans]|uniref:ArsR/SmtB family transcription factor n=1 Tax=Microbacterium sulfonylureivorans TaxID=2486854 RepID=UPI000FD9F674|nr:helix-turn-helix domain-containing protein [Microbacterium sulfonylureivorans]
MSDVERLVIAFAALANASRLSLLRELSRPTPRNGHLGGGQTISELAAKTELSRFAASRHLGILREAGLVHGVRDGSRMLHRLEGAALDEIDDWLFPLLISAGRAEPTALHAPEASAR